MTTKIIRDESTSSAFWGAINTLCALDDVHVIADAPVGCYNLTGVAVIDYTDAIAYLDNLTPTNITESSVSKSGTLEITRETLEKLGRTEKQLIVISSAESEMMGASHEQFLNTHFPDVKFFLCKSLEDDEWTGRDKVLSWCFDLFDDGKPHEIEPGSVSIIGPTYGCFNAYADLAELKRLIEGAGGKVKTVFPLESSLKDISALKHSEVIVVMYEEFGSTLAKKCNRPLLRAPFGLHHTEQFILDLGAQLNTTEQAKAFLETEKQTTLKLIWDLWKGPQSEWFPTVMFGVASTKTYVEGLKTCLQDDLGMRCVYAFDSREGTNQEVREALLKQAPQIMFGRIVDKIYLNEAKAKTRFIPAGFPGPIVRRALGTPFMGFSGVVYLVQEIINIMYETLFTFLPADDPTQPVQTQPGKPIEWEPQAQAMLQEITRKAPFISQISFSRGLKKQAEQLALTQGKAKVTLEIIQQLQQKN
jgi:chlorophyllide a reductase subunit Z